MTKSMNGAIELVAIAVEGLLLTLKYGDGHDREKATNNLRIATAILQTLAEGV